MGVGACADLPADFVPVEGEACQHPELIANEGETGGAATRYRWGIAGGRVISPYGARRPGAYAQRIHKGEDVGCETGTPVRALGDATVYRVRDNGSVSGYVQEVTLYYPSVGRYVLYGHVRRGIPVRVGERVRRGDLFARCGTISDASGGVPSRGAPAHIHVQVWSMRGATDYYNNDAALDPEPTRRALGEVAVPWRATFVDQTFPLASEAFVLAPGEIVSGFIRMRNSGEHTWRPGEVFLGTTEPRDGSSPLMAGDWINDHRAATINRVVEPGEVGRFDFSVRAPVAAGEHPQFFNLVREHVTWFSDAGQGGPADDQLQIRVTVDGARCAVGTEAWRCEGMQRARCVEGATERELCEYGCDAGSCLPPVDADGDGYSVAADCDDQDPLVHPGANDACGDGLDWDCDGVDPACPLSPEDAGSPDAAARVRLDGSTPDASIDPGTEMGGPGLESGCHAAGTLPAGASWLLGFVLWAARRRAIRPA